MKFRPIFWAAVAMCASVAFFSRFLPQPPRAYLAARRHQPGIFDAQLDPMRKSITDMIERRIPRPYHSIAKAILLGDQSDMDPSLRDTFSKSGTAHLLAISGGNIILVATSLVALFRLLYVPRRLSYAAVIGILIFYCLLTGSSASVVRATTMVSIFLAGFILRRDSEILTSLACSAIAILAFDPLQFFDLGFQLSFLSVFMIAAVCGEWEDFEIPLESSAVKKAWIYLSRAVGVSLAAWIGVAPLSACVFSMISPVTIIANLVLVPVFNILQVAGFMFLILGSVHSSVEEILGYALMLVCRAAVFFSDCFVAIPYSWFPVRAPGLLEVSIFYAVLIAGIFWINRPREKA